MDKIKVSLNIMFRVGEFNDAEKIAVHKKMSELLSAERPECPFCGGLRAGILIRINGIHYMVTAVVIDLNKSQKDILIQQQDSRVIVKGDA